MKKSFLFVLFLSLAMIPYVSFAQKDKKVIEKIIELGTTDNQSMKHLDVLCNRFGGRVLGSDAYDNAAEWAAYMFKKWGMEVEMQEVGELPVGFNRGHWSGHLLGKNAMELHFVTPSYTSGTHGVQKGHVLIEPYTQEEFDRMKLRLKGAYVLVGGESSGWPLNHTAKANAKRDSLIALNAEISVKNNEIRRANWRKPREEREELIERHEQPGLFYNQMVEAGVLGFIQSASVPLAALYDRQGLDEMTWETLPTVPDIKLDEHQYAIIKQMAEERRSFELEFDIRNYFKLGPVKYHNVIGIIPGTEFPDEYVMFGGHLDSFDAGTGGVDDGSGVTPTMEAARLIMEAGGKPKRTMLFCLWAGEEFGLLGSKAWVEENKDKLPNILNYFNRDGGPTVALGLSVTEAMMEDMKKVCEPVNSINPDFPFELSTREARRVPTRGGGSDHAYFSMNAVPTMSFNTDDPKGYNFSYREIWHTDRDIYNKSIPEYQEHTATVMAVVGYGMANLKKPLSREGYYITE